MDISTTYLGLSLRSPLVPSASPLTSDLDNLKRLEDHGAGAVVLASLFEEQLRAEQEALDHHLEQGTESFAEALSYFPRPSEFRTGPEAYLDLISKAKEALEVPVIASLNGASKGGWTQFAKQMQEAGADAIELNVYRLPTDLDVTGVQVEQGYLDILASVREAVKVPVAVKLSPFFSSLANVAMRLDEGGAKGLVLFNRFYQPDIDLDQLQVSPTVSLSDSSDLRLPLRWIAILHGRVGCDLAGTSGVHTPEDALKLLMAGAQVAMVCGALLKHGVEHLGALHEGLTRWLTGHEYESVKQLQGSVSQRNCAGPATFERAQYMRTLQSYRA